MTTSEVINYRELAQDQRRMAARFYRRARKVQHHAAEYRLWAREATARARHYDQMGSDA